MQVRTQRLLAAAFGVVLAATVNAAEPAKLKTSSVVPAKLPELKAPSQLQDTKSGTALVANQKLADKVADKLSDVSAMQNAEVSLLTAEGTVTVVGSCKDASTKKTILDAVSKVDGVKLVKDGIKVGNGVKQAQAMGGPLASPAPSGMPVPMGMPAPGAGYAGPDVEPLPLGPAGGMGAGAPPLPSHAWPTYAPYPNLSRVAYPTSYPQNAFPYIGPFYPFPKVPLGWRSVTLSMEDGHWWLGRKSTPQDYWRVKFGY